MTCTSEYNGPTPTGLRIRIPDDPALYQPRKFCYVLPVKPDDSTEFGDGFNELVSQNFHNLYNCVLIAPEFHLEPWIADHPTIGYYQYDKFMLELRQFCINNLPAATEHWIISFSKGGTSATTLFFKYPTFWDRIAIWDAPISDAEVPDGSVTIDQIAYGTQQNYDDNYDIFANLTTWISANSSFFTGQKRIWLGAFGSIAAYTADMEALSDSLDAESVPHYLDNISSTGTHSWTGGGGSGYWLDNAIEGLYRAKRSVTVNETKPPSSYQVDTAHSISDSLEVAVLFNEGSGTTVRNLGTSALTTANLDTSAPAHSWSTDFFSGERILNAASGANPLDFGSFLGLDQANKTIIVWMQFTAQGGNQEMVDTKSPDGYSFYNDDGELAFQPSSGQIGVDTGPLGIPNGAMRMLGIRWNASTKDVRYTIDGVTNSTVNIAGANEQPSSDTLQLGFGLAGGAFKQLRMYDRELSDSEIENLATNPYLGYMAAKVTATVTTFSLTGIAANLKHGRLTSAAVASYSLAGQNANLLWHHIVVGGTGVYVLTGQDAILVEDNSVTMQATSQSYVLTGQAATLTATHNPLAANTAAYALTGIASSLEYGRVVVGGTGTYTLTGINVVLAIVMPAGTGAFTLTGKDATLVYASDVTMPAEAGAYTLVGINASLKYSRIMQATTVAYALSGKGVTLTEEIAPPPTSGGQQSFGGGRLYSRGGAIGPRLLPKIRLPSEAKEEEQEAIRAKEEEELALMLTLLV